MSTIIYYTYSPLFENIRSKIGSKLNNGIYTLTTGSGNFFDPYSEPLQYHFVSSSFIFIFKKKSLLLVQCVICSGACLMVKYYPVHHYNGVIVVYPYAFLLSFSIFFLGSHWSYSPKVMLFCFLFVLYHNASFTYHIDLIYMHLLSGVSS